MGQLIKFGPKISTYSRRFTFPSKLLDSLSLSVYFTSWHPSPSTSPQFRVPGFKSEPRRLGGDGPRNLPRHRRPGPASSGRQPPLSQWAPSGFRVRVPGRVASANCRAPGVQVGARAGVTGVTAGDSHSHYSLAPLEPEIACPCLGWVAVSQ